MASNGPRRAGLWAHRDTENYGPDGDARAPECITGGLADRAIGQIGPAGRPSHVSIA